MSQVDAAEVSLPQKYKDLFNGVPSYKVDDKLEEMITSKTVTQVTREEAGDKGNGLLNGDGVFLADMRMLNTQGGRNDPYIDLADFKKHYVWDFFRVKHASNEYSRIVFIKVIGVAFGGSFGRYGTDKKQIFNFYAYHPDGEFIGKNCSREIQSDTAHQSAITVPAPCVYDLPVEVLKSHHVNLYKMDIPETLISEVGSGASGGLDPSVGGGKKLRSAKQTSKRRSVKSKPRYYRRSVGSINHRRKKTTRRRK